MSGQWPKNVEDGKVPPREIEVEYVVIAGKQIPASLIICPVCNILDLGTAIDARGIPWEAVCSKGHTWKIHLD